MTDQTRYPVAHQFSIRYSAYEDRLVLATELKEQGHTTVLLTRRMVLMVLKHLLDDLPGLSGLNQTPANYWQDVLALTHQQALAQQRQEVENPPQNTATGEVQATEAELSAEPPAETRADQPMFLATELTSKQASGRQLLGFKGIPMPEGMQGSCLQVPVLALSLEIAHVHQLIRLLITHATKANWHLPVDLPWASASTGTPPARVASH